MILKICWIHPKANGDYGGKDLRKGKFWVWSGR